MFDVPMFDTVVYDGTLSWWRKVLRLSVTLGTLLQREVVLWTTK
jgi:branched-subunit amino acid transport protein AzlD